MGENLILCIELVDYVRSHESLYIEDIYNVIENVLELSPSEHVGVIQSGGKGAPKSYNVGIKNMNIWNDHQLDSVLDHKYKISSGKVVLLQRAYERYEYVTVKNIPPHWGKRYVDSIFNKYGIVVSMHQETLRYSV